MILGVNGNLKFVLFSMLYVLALNGLVAASAQAQQVDPGRAIDGDLAVNNAAPTKAPPVSGAAPSTASVEAHASPASVTDAAPPAAPVEAAAKAKAKDKTFQKDDLVGADHMKSAVASGPIPPSTPSMAVVLPSSQSVLSIA